MNKYLNQLIELSKIDKEIDSFGPRIEKIEQALTKALEEQEAAQGELDKVAEQVKEAKLKKSQHELQIEELAAKIDTIGKKSAAVKSEKEQKALQLEEEICKEQCDFSNEEIERLERVIEAKSEQEKEIETSLKSVQTKVNEAKKEIESQMQEIEKERAIVFKKKQELVEKMSQKILAFYEKIRKWAKDSAVVPVKKQACYGCFMRINDKTYSAVIKSEDIITCPHCGRILYKEAQEPKS